jgi:hypothetical protein
MWQHYPSKIYNGISFSDENGIILVDILPVVTTLNFNCYVEALISLNACLLWVRPTRKIPEVLLLHNNTWLHRSVCITEAIIRLGWTVFLHPLYSLLAPLNSSMYYCLVQAFPPLLQPLTHSILQCFITGITVSSQLFFKGLGPIEPPNQGVLGSFLVVKRLRCKVSHSPPSSVEVKNEWGYICTPPVFLHGVDRENFTFTLPDRW